MGACPFVWGILSDVDQEGTAVVQDLSDTRGSEKAIGHLVSEPVSSDPGTAATELLYEIPNEKGNFMPGQKVNVSLPLQQTQKNLVVPYSAIIYDLEGGQWVYTNPEPNVFVRKRVQVQYITDNLAIISRGIEANTKVVTKGAAELSELNSEA